MTKKNLNVPAGERVSFPDLEERVLDYWDDVGAFEKSVEQRDEDKPFVFYDGPPFATGLPHYGHLLGSVMKDIVPRYWTMKGYRVDRKWGWDCHGLPIENIVEKELNLKHGKKDIEKLGIDKFNDACRAAIWRFDKEWEKVIRRIGRWVDFKNSYKTMDTDFMESVWWAFKEIHDKGLVYEGKKVILYCPRCATPLSNFEIAMDNSYKQVSEESTTYKYKVKGKENTFILAWSTTPWNKIVTPALAVNPDLDYVVVEQDGENYVVAKSRKEAVLGDEGKEVDRLSGSELAQWEFEPHYSFFVPEKGKKTGVLIADEFVSDEEGTGVVTLAVYGEDDFRVMSEHDIQLIEHVDDEGKLKEEVTPWAGMDILEVNPLVDEELASRGLVYKREPHVHNVAVCYRCDTRLYYAPVPAWFVDIQKLKPDMVKNNEPINWFPNHLKKGRFGKGLETAPDWNISRSRYWGTPMPVWVAQSSTPKGGRAKLKAQSQKQYRVIGSIEELKQWAVNPEQVEGLTDIHREFVDEIEVWVDDEKTIKGTRIPEVFDCWVESGSMPYASEHYPFENQKRFEARHPAQFISEYIAQTRAWFYTLHVMSTALFGKHTFENALTTGTIMAEDGNKMSKSKRNFVDPMILVDKYGVDSLRMYFASSPLMKTAENVNFSEAQVDEIRKKVFNIFWNVFSFYRLYDDESQEFDYPKQPEHVMDKWLISKTEKLSQTVIEAMDGYDVTTSSRALMGFVNEFSTWWLRLSRDRLRDKKNNAQVLQVFRTTLLRWSLLIAPFAPFFAEMVYQNLVQSGKKSIHLEDLPEFDVANVNDELEREMQEIAKAVEKTHAARKEQAIKVRQPLAEVVVDSPVAKPDAALLDIMAQEVNVKRVTWKKAKELSVDLDTKLTPELKAEGEAREIIRNIQKARRKAGTAMDEQIEVVLPDWPADFEEEIKTKVLAVKMEKGEELEVKRIKS